MAIPPRFLDELRARVGLAEVIGRTVRLTKKGREYQGLCPFHKEKTPSFTVNEEKGFYHCFGCGAHGSAIDFVMNAEGLGFREAVEKLAGEAGMEVPQDSPEERERAKKRDSLHEVVERAAQAFERWLRMPEGKAGLDYLHGRGLDDATIRHFRLGFAPDSRGLLKGHLAHEGVTEEQMVEAGLVIRPDDPNRQSYDRFRGRVMFPITDRRGRVVAFGGRTLGDGEPKYLNSPETALFHKGRLLYGLAQALPAARQAGTILVTEGYMDVIALARAGLTHAVAPLGTALTEDQILELWKIAPEPVLCFDGDSAGQRAAGRAAERALPLLRPGVGLRFAVLPSGEDPDSLIKGSGVQAMDKVLAQAAPLSEVLWRMEAGSRMPSAAEERAALQKRLEDHARAIQDATVRSHFLRGFKDRLWQAARQGRGGGNRPPAPPAPVDGRAAAAARIEGRGQAERVLAAAVLNHPALFHQVEEELGTLAFRDEDLDALRQAMLALLSEEPEWTPEALVQALREQGFEGSLAALFADPLVRRHRYLRPGATPEDVRETWRENADVLKRAAFEDELKRDRAEGDLTDDDAWADQMRRLVAQKRAQHGES